MKRTLARFLIVSYSTDWLFTTSQSKELVTTLMSYQRHVTFRELDSPFGHDSFLLDFEPLEEMVRPFLQHALKARRTSTVGGELR